MIADSLGLIRAANRRPVKRRQAIQRQPERVEVIG